MRTSLRFFAAATSVLITAAFLTVVPGAKPAAAVNGVNTVSVAVDHVSYPENGNPTITVTVTVNPLNFVPTNDITADIVTQDGTARAGGANPDYTANTKHVTFAAFSSTTQTYTLNNILDDSFREPDETFNLVVTNVQNASAGSGATVTIADNETGNVPSVVITPSPDAPEGDADNTRTVMVKLANHGAGAAYASTVTLNYATTEVSASPDPAKGAKDYDSTSGLLTWGPNSEVDQPINITVHGDTIPEPDETFNVDFGSPNNATLGAGSPSPVKLQNDDAGTVPAFSLSAIPDKTEGDAGTSTQTVTVTLDVAAQQITTVDYATGDAADTATPSDSSTKNDYDPAKGTLTFPQGTTSKSFNVTINGDPVDEQDETYSVKLSNPHNATIAANQGTKQAKILNDDYGQISTVPASNGGPHTRTFGATGSDLGGFFAYDQSLTSGLHVGRGDFFKADGSPGADGVDEIITAPSQFPKGSNFSSRPLVRIFATDGTQRASFFAFDSGFTGGVFVAAGNLDGDPSNGDELVVGAGPTGGPQVRILRVKTAGDNVAALGGFYAYDPAFTGGVRVAVANENGSGNDEIVTAPGPGGGPHVRTFDGNGNAIGGGFMAYDPAMRSGMSIAAAAGYIVTGALAGGGPHVRVFNGSGTAQGGGFYAYSPDFHGGVYVGLGNLDNNLAPEIVTGAGPGGGPHVRVFSLDGTPEFGGGFFAYDPAFTGGVEVAVSTAAS